MQLNTNFVVLGRRYGEPRPKHIPIEKKLDHGHKGIIGGKGGIIGKKSGFIDGWRKKGFLSGSKKGLKEGIIKDTKVLPGKKTVLPGKHDLCPPRPCLQTQEFIPVECRRPQFFMHNGHRCPDCDIDICVGGPISPGIGGGWNDGGLGPVRPVGPVGPVGPVSPGGLLPGDLEWQGGIGTNGPLGPGGINAGVNGGLFPGSQIGGPFGRGQFEGEFGGFDQFGIQNGGRFGSFSNNGRNGLVNRLNEGFGDFDPSWNTGNVGDLGNSWGSSRFPANRQSRFV